MTYILTNDLIELAVKNNCSIFLEEIWEESKKFGDYKKNKNTVKLCFVNILVPMIEYKKIQPASDAIKYWSEVYKEEGVFNILLDYKEEELLM